MKKDVIEEFFEGAEYYIEMLKTCNKEMCPVCGMRAESFKRLVEAVRKLKDKQ